VATRASRWIRAEPELRRPRGGHGVLFGVALGFCSTSRSRSRAELAAHAGAPLRTGQIKPMVEGLLESFFEGLQALRNPLDLAAAWRCRALLDARSPHVLPRRTGIRHPRGFHIFCCLTAAANLAIAIVATQGGVGAFELVVSRRSSPSGRICRPCRLQGAVRGIRDWVARTAAVPDRRDRHLPHVVDAVQLRRHAQQQPERRPGPRPGRPFRRASLARGG